MRGSGRVKVEHVTVATTSIATRAQFNLILGAVQNKSHRWFIHANRQFTCMNNIIGHMWHMTLSLRLQKPVDDLIKLFNNAGLWISLRRNSTGRFKGCISVHRAPLTQTSVITWWDKWIQMNMFSGEFCVILTKTSFHSFYLKAEALTFTASAGISICLFE